MEDNTKLRNGIYPTDQPVTALRQISPPTHMN